MKPNSNCVFKDDALDLGPNGVNFQCFPDMHSFPVSIHGIFLFPMITMIRKKKYPFIL